MAKQRDDQNSPVLNFVFGTFIVIVSTIWLIRGEIILPNKAVFLFGTHARITAALLMLFALSPLAFRIHRKLKSKNQTEGQGCEQHLGQVSSEAAPSAPPDEPSR